MQDFTSVMDPLMANRISRQIEDAVSDTERFFPVQKADEDAVSGSLGANLMSQVSGEIVLGEKAYVWDTRAHVVRGKGPNAPENAIGADGLIEIRIVDVVTGKLISCKGLPFQAKKHKNDSGLFEQVKKLKDLSCSSIVIDYSDNGFTGVTEKDLLDAEGKFRNVKSEKFVKLGKLLGEMFLNCKVGRQHITYNPDAERVVDLSNATSPYFLSLVPKNLVTTTIVQCPSQGYRYYLKRRFWDIR